MKTFAVVAHWDPNSRVWWADSDEIPGLAIEADTREHLDENVKMIAPELVLHNLGYTDSFYINMIEAAL